MGRLRTQKRLRRRPNRDLVREPLRVAPNRHPGANATRPDNARAGDGVGETASATKAIKEVMVVPVDTTHALSLYVARMKSMVDAKSRLQVMRAGGQAGKEAGLKAAVIKLGADRAMSNFRWGHRVPLKAGYDVTESRVEINHTPKGVWLLADKGRFNGGRIYPRTANGRKGRKAVKGRALRTPEGPRAASSYTPSKGTNVFKLAAAMEREAVPKGAATEMTRVLAEFVRRS